MDSPEQTVLQVTITEAARRLGYCRRTVYNMLDANEIRAVGAGRMRRIAVAELHAWQERNTR